MRSSVVTRIALVLLIAVLPVTASADLNVFACEPEWAALAEEIGQSHVNAFSATTALQDPHYIQARPSLIARVRRADLVICSGAQLEIGWLPALLQKANNRDVLPGNSGYMEASRYVKRLDTTGNVDRSKGDIHPQGNPHIQTDPHNVAAVARALGERMAALDPNNAAIYEAGLESFSARWLAAISGWEVKAEPLRGTRAITHHKSWVYLEHWLGIEEVANLEAIPGLPPTVTHLSRLTSQFGDGGADFIVRSPYQDGRPSEWLSERTGIAAIVLPLTVGGTDEAGDLFSLFDDIIDRLLGASVLSRKFVSFQRVSSRLLARQVAPVMAGPLPSGVTPPRALKDAPFWLALKSHKLAGQDTSYSMPTSRSTFRQPFGSMLPRSARSP